MREEKIQQLIKQVEIKTAELEAAPKVHDTKAEFFLFFLDLI